MGNIFAQASRVVAWLGWIEAHTCVDFMLKVQSSGHKSAIQLLQDISPAFELPKSTERPIVQPSRMQQEDLLELCTRSYWERLWIIQELVLAQEVRVQCGNLKFDSGLFGNVERSLLQALDYRQRLRVLNSLPLKIIKLRQERQERVQDDEESESDLEVDNIHIQRRANGNVTGIDERASSLLDVMYEASLSKCMDRRDKIFG